ncbi:MAG TPA: hypothetical protein VFV02_03920 [Acidimicrobiales bacterium]|nr:hypothetical protein [Acidimicrobiales bacterium]
MTLCRPEKSAAVTRVVCLERLLFDGSGHPRRRISPERADELLCAINQLRRQLGWLCLNMQRQLCWPDDA